MRAALRPEEGGGVHGGINIHPAEIRGTRGPQRPSTGQDVSGSGGGEGGPLEVAVHENVVAEHGPVLVAVLNGGRGDSQGRPGRARDVAPGGAAIGARLPLGGGCWRPARRRGE